MRFSVIVSPNENVIMNINVNIYKFEYKQIYEYHCEDEFQGECE